MQTLNIIDIRTYTLCIDSTSIKVHPDAAGTRKINSIPFFFNYDDYDFLCEHAPNYEKWANIITSKVKR